MWTKSLTDFYFIILLRFINCCQCDKHQEVNRRGETASLNLTDVYSEKPQLEHDADDYSTEYSNREIEKVTAGRVYRNTARPLTESNVYPTDASLDINDSTEASEIIYDVTDATTDFNDSTKVTEPTTEFDEVTNRKKKHLYRELAKKCRHFKKSAAFDLEKMADIWQVVYYRLPNKLKCFKIHIKLVTSKSQIRFAKLYGNFNNTVQWGKCNLEIKSHEQIEGGTRRHFLQGDAVEKGVMENIIIDEEHCHNTTYLTLHRESADQWLVIKNLLVMRDCETRDLVVFSRVPSEPRRDDILDALMVFGEHKPNGTVACQNKSEKSWMKFEDAYTES